MIKRAVNVSQSNFLSLFRLAGKRTTALFFVMLATACTPAPEPSSFSSKALSFEPCRLPPLSMEIQCTRLDVPQSRVPKDRAHPDQGTLSLHVARLPANTQHPEADPLVLLARGPGQAASALAPFAAALVETRRHRDILLIDQRGTGRSSPLRCAALDEKSDALSDTVLTDIAPKVGQCLDQLTAQSVNPLDYGTSAFVEDIEAVRDALKLSRINLWGGSYGTRVALEYLRRYPQHVRTLTLDGVMAPSVRITLNAWRSRDAQLNTLLQRCEASESCRTLQPSPAAALDTLLARLTAPGLRVTFNDSRTGNTETWRLDSDMLLSALQPLLYSPDTTALLPQVLTAALNNDFAPLLALTQSFSSTLEGQMNPALYYAITCAEDVPRVSGEERATLQTDLPHVGALAAQSFAACERWPAATLPDDWGAPIVNDNVPVLLLSGAFDPVTPPAYAAETAQTLAKHRLITASGVGHITSAQACAPQLLAAFVKSADLSTLSQTCIEHLENNAPPLLWSNPLMPAP
ncbi:MAG: alpha/beta hydrolase [Burkholderiales bacterium]|jgi:pimeloyl-ACP methyl ester carboxylesterase|nr:alpha/beta hydrolase [Burkholderiales bacterium]